MLAKSLVGSLCPHPINLLPTLTGSMGCRHGNFCCGARAAGEIRVVSVEGWHCSACGGGLLVDSCQRNWSHACYLFPLSGNGTPQRTGAQQSWNAIQTLQSNTTTKCRCVNRYAEPPGRLPVAHIPPR